MVCSAVPLTLRILCKKPAVSPCEVHSVIGGSFLAALDVVIGSPPLIVSGQDLMPLVRVLRGAWAYVDDSCRERLCDCILTVPGKGT